MGKKKLLRAAAGTRGLPPGTAVYVGHERAEAVGVSLMDYDAEGVRDERVTDVARCLPLKDSPTVTWINVDGVHDVGLIQSIGEGYGLHPLVLEDILNTDQRPKFEDYGEYIYVVVKMLQWDAAACEANAEQVSLVLGRNFVLSFQERPGDVFETVRERIRSGKGRIRGMGADYLAYALLDAIVDGYFLVLEKRGDQVEALEEEVITRPKPATLQKIYALRREGLFTRRCVWPMREVVAGLERAESELVSEALHVFVRDLYDHTVQAIDTTETFREMLSGMLDTYLSSLSNHMNEVMKVLTIIATIFIPLSFVAGLYGMNFEYMPETKWSWGYFGALGLMAAIAAGMLYYIKRKRWM